MKLSVPREIHTLSPKLAEFPGQSSAAGLPSSSSFKPSLKPSWQPVSQAELSDSWLQYGASCQLRNVDLRILRAQDPLPLTTKAVKAYAQRLQECLDAREWERCTVALAVFVRSDLTDVAQSDAVYYALENLAQLATMSNPLDAPDAAGTTARLGRVLLSQMLVIGKQLDAAAKAGNL